MSKSFVNLVWIKVLNRSNVNFRQELPYTFSQPHWNLSKYFSTCDFKAPQKLPKITQTRDCSKFFDNKNLCLAFFTRNISKNSPRRRLFSKNLEQFEEICRWMDFHTLKHRTNPKHPICSKVLIEKNSFF